MKPPTFNGFAWLEIPAILGAVIGAGATAIGLAFILLTQGSMGWDIFGAGVAAAVGFGVALACVAIYKIVRRIEWRLEQAAKRARGEQ